MEGCDKRTEYVSQPCELCFIEGLSTQADGFCHECLEHMCNKCFQHHIKAKSCRNHVLSPLGQSVMQGKKQPESNVKCNTHVRENVKYYCCIHDMVACGDCILAEHNGCKMDFIEKLPIKQFEKSSEFNDIVRTIKKLEAEQLEKKAQLDSHRKENKACLDTALAEIKKFRTDINEYLDKVEKEIIFEANKMAKQNDDVIDQVEKMLSLAEQDIGDIRNTLDANMIQGETLFIRTKQYKPKLSKVGESASLIRTNNIIRGFTFNQEKRLADMMKSGVKLGSFRRDIVTTKGVETKQSYCLTDPRAAGFDVGLRVKENRYVWSLTGVVTKVYDTGYVTVRWDHNGSESRKNAGAGGKFDVKLLPN